MMSTAANPIQQHPSSAFRHHHQHHHSDAIDRIIDSPIAKHAEQDAIRQALWQPIIDLDVHTVLADLPLPSKDVRRRDIAVSTDIKLERTKDQDDEERSHFASEIAYAIGSELQKAGYSGKASDARYELSIVVTTASAGSARGRILAADLGYGHTKLALVYALTETAGCCKDNAEEGQIIKAGRIRKTDSLGEGWDDLIGLFEKGNIGNKKLTKNIVPDAAREISETIGV